MPHSAQTCTRGPCVCKCFRIAELSRNILVQPCKSKEKQNIPQYTVIPRMAKRTQTGYQSIVIIFSCLKIILRKSGSYTESGHKTDKQQKINSMFNKVRCWKLRFDSTRHLGEQLLKCTRLVYFSLTQKNSSPPNKKSSQSVTNHMLLVSYNHEGL